jgi:hypothetical protein
MDAVKAWINALLLFTEKAPDEPEKSVGPPVIVTVIYNVMIIQSIALQWLQKDMRLTINMAGVVRTPLKISYTVTLTIIHRGWIMNDGNELRRMNEWACRVPNQYQCHNQRMLLLMVTLMMILSNRYPIISLHRHAKHINKTFKNSVQMMNNQYDTILTSQSISWSLAPSPICYVPNNSIRQHTAAARAMGAMK